jgi:hypothetical protein
MAQSNVCKLLSKLPFYGMDDREFNNLFGLCSRELDIESDLHNLLCNPDKRDESDPDLMLNILNNAGSNSLSLFHCDIRIYLKI